MISIGKGVDNTAFRDMLKELAYGCRTTNERLGIENDRDICDVDPERCSLRAGGKIPKYYCCVNGLTIDGGLPECLTCGNMCVGMQKAKEAFEEGRL